MGVPGYYKWLLQHCEAIQKKEMHVDNLYLDMNGILHPVCHEDGESVNVLSEDMMLSNFCIKLDEIIQKTRPRKLIYLAFDGPAPNAKMVQQRSRRFCSRENMNTHVRLYETIAEEWRNNNGNVPELPPMWDSNKITPGTPFMGKVRKTVESYISNRISDSGWKAYQKVTWLLSDSSEPGEGEHKLIQFIKKQRTSKGYDSSLTHCLVGNDADLIQLALSIHDPNVMIFRDDQYICIKMVREYFRKCFESIIDDKSIPSELRNFERLLDDLLLCFCFVGNDFIPPLPQMKISSNAIGRCLSIYISELPVIGDFLTCAGKINPISLDKFVKKLAIVLESVSDPTEEIVRWYERLEGNYLKEYEHLASQPDQPQKHFWNEHKRRCELHLWNETLQSLCKDNIGMGLPRWQDRYYQKHWPDDGSLEAIQVRVSQEYLRGLQWVQSYYHQECPDWEWFYPYEHGPTLDNFHPESCDLDCLKFSSKGGPLQTLQQLLIVIPREGAEILGLPKSLIALMDTDLKEYFPQEYPKDFSNCPPKWMAKAILPPIDLEKVRRITVPQIEALELKEKKLVHFIQTRLFVHCSHPISHASISCDKNHAFNLQTSEHGLKGQISNRKSKKNSARISQNTVRFCYDFPDGKIFPLYLTNPPDQPKKKLINARNSKSPLNTDPRRHWAGMNGLSYPLWGVKIDSTGTLCYLSKKNA